MAEKALSCSHLWVDGFEINKMLLDDQACSLLTPVSLGEWEYQCVFVVVVDHIQNLFVAECLG